MKTMLFPLYRNPVRLRFLAPAAIFFTCAYASAQTPSAGAVPASRAKSRPGSPDQVEIFPYGYSLMDPAFSQGIGAETLVPENGFAASFINPAVLADSNRSGTAAMSLAYASLYPNLNFPDLNETAWEAHYRHADWGYSLKLRRHDFGSTPVDSVTASPSGSGVGMEYSLSLARAFSLSPRLRQAFGVTFTVIKAPASFVDKGATEGGYSMDAGYYGTWGRNFRWGAALDNVGFPIEGVRPEIVRSRYPGYQVDERLLISDPGSVLTPMGIHVGGRISESAHLHGIEIVGVGITAVLSGQFPGYSFRDAQRFWIGAADVEVAKTLRLRAGRLDGEGEMAVNRFAADLGLFRHVEIGFALATARDALYDGQKSFHVGCYDLLDWGRGDWTWWRD
ncbi:MAG: hypothetical protein JF616_11015 [Fibrobacteres bacterium]|nr:hypothetical protein [Fibrobacterota bacterium]